MNVLTVAEIQTRYPGEWILVENPQTDAALEVQGGVVRCHDKSRETVYRKAVELRLPRFAMLYTGTFPADTAVVL